MPPALSDVIRRLFRHMDRSPCFRRRGRVTACMLFLTRSPLFSFSEHSSAIFTAFGESQPVLLKCAISV
jgi:hypothetical protein